MKRTILGVLILGAGVVALVSWRATRVEPVSVTLVSVQRGSVYSNVSNTRAGTVNICNRARVSSIISGQIAVLPVAEGN